MKSLFHDISVAWFISKRTLMRMNRSTVFLMIFVTTIAFTMLVAVPGVLVGLIDGGNNANRNQYTSDLIVIRQSGEKSIKYTSDIVEYVSKSSLVKRYSVRYAAGITIQAGVGSRSDFTKEKNQMSTQVIGIDTVAEDNLTHLSKYVVEGEYFKPNETGYIMLGANLIKKYNSNFGDQFDSLENVNPGDKVHVSINGKQFDFIVKGIFKTKVGEVSMRAFLPESELALFENSGSREAAEIAIEMNNSALAPLLQQYLQNAGYGAGAKIQIASEAIPQFLNQIKQAFGLLGNIIGFIVLIVTGTTIFIIIFMNALSRQKYIGILMGIGISPRVIVLSYIIQSLFYALCGAIIASGVIYGLLVPAVDKHPIDFPFSDGIVSAPFSGTLTRFYILISISFLAGLIPSWRIVRRNTLNSILGR